MNYLGHAMLSFGDPEILVGNMIGDHVKGKLALQHYPEKVQTGILIHRKIDAFTDEHPASKRAKLWFREAYGLYAGAIMDSIYDHFLANDPKHFGTSAELLAFSQSTYETLAQQQTHFPPMFRQYFPYMQEQNWLYNYRTMQGMQRSLNGLHRRAAHMPPIDKAYELFVGHYYQLAQCYYDFMEDIVPFVKLELTRRHDV